MFLTFHEVMQLSLQIWFDVILALQMFDFDNLELEILVNLIKLFVTGLMHQHVMLLVDTKDLVLTCLSHQIIAVLALLVSWAEHRVGLNEVFYQSYSYKLHILKS